MINPKTLYNNRPRTKSIAEYDKVLSIPGAEKKALELMNQYIKDLGRENKQVNYIEIGVWLGGTFSKILQTAKSENIKINALGIDLFEDFEVKDDNNTHYGDVANRKDIDKKLRENRLDDFKLIKGDSVKIINTLSKMKNVVCFIDANHTYEAVKADFEAILPKVENGYIVFDDLNWITIDKFFNELVDQQYKIQFRNNRTGVIKIG